MRPAVCIFTLLTLLALPRPALAHPMVENALEIVISPTHLTLTARISMEQIKLAQSADKAPRERWPEIVDAHAPYLLKHLLLKAEGKPLTGKLLSAQPPDATQGSSAMALYKFEYPLAAPPQLIRIDQDLLIDFPPWTAPCVVRIKQSNQQAFQSALLTREKSIDFTCDAIEAPGFWRVAREFLVEGIHHILTGYDHLLFVCALVLATARVWELVKVVTAFTIAHTITLTLCIFNIFSLTSRIVEPMIAASIIFVALQNIFAPRSSKGWTRLAVAFAFGLFHGLGFAGGLKDAMSEMPGSALGAALGGFSIGVEIGHQIVVLPLFGLLYLMRNFHAELPRVVLYRRVLKIGSAAISLGGVYFFLSAMHLI